MNQNHVSVPDAEASASVAIRENPSLYSAGRIYDLYVVCE